MCGIVVTTPAAAPVIVIGITSAIKYSSLMLRQHRNWDGCCPISAGSTIRKSRKMRKQSIFIFRFDRGLIMMMCSSRWSRTSRGMCMLRQRRRSNIIRFVRL